MKKVLSFICILLSITRGASPIYLLGKYYLGVKPTSPTYVTYVIEPQLGGLQWIEGKMPTPDGDVSVYCSAKEVKVTGAAGTGTLRFKSKTRLQTGRNPLNCQRCV